MRKILCSIGIHKYKEENFPVTEEVYGCHLALGCDVCTSCGKVRKSHKKYLAEMRHKAGLTTKALAYPRFLSETTQAEKESALNQLGEIYLFGDDEVNTLGDQSAFNREG